MNASAQRQRLAELRQEYATLTQLAAEDPKWPRIGEDADRIYRLALATRELVRDVRGGRLR